VAGLPLEVVARSSSYVAVRYLPVLPVPSVDVVGMSSARLRRLSSATGVSALALGAIAKVESASLGDKAHRFEPHVFLRRVGGLSRGDDAYKSVDSLKLLAAEHGISYSPRSGGYVSFVRSETDWSAYELAAALSFDDAVLSSSWGRFQVMGFNFPATFKADLPGTVQRFVENPAEFSDVTLFHWFASRPAAVDAARSADWVSFAVLYNGKAEPYASRISSAYSELAAGGGS
jgi:hypothetical protein